MKKWLPLVALAGAQFIMVLDQSVMNVSISQLVEDFDTTVTVIQAGPWHRWSHWRFPRLHTLRFT